MGIHSVQSLAPVARMESATGAATGGTNDANSAYLFLIEIVVYILIR